MKRVKFIVIEKSYLIRKGIVSIINRIEKASVVFETDSITNLNNELVKYKPDFIVLNIELLKVNEKSKYNSINFDLEQKGIAIINPHLMENYIQEKFREIIYVNDEKNIIFNKIENLIEKNSGKESLILQNELSNREITILEYIAKGFTNKEIADKLFLSAHTVITHRKNITNKLGIKTIPGLTIYAILHNIITLNDIK